MFNYNPLWKTLIDHKMNKTDLHNRIKCSWSTITTMGKNENVSMDVLDRICKTLNCKIEDVIEFVNEDKESD